MTSRRSTRAAWFLLGVCATLPQLLRPLQGGMGRGWEMIEVARTLAATGRFADPFMAAPTGPTATVPPGYPAVLSLFARWFGGGEGLMWSALALCLVAHGLCVMLLAITGERLTGNPRAGSWAAVLACALPAFPFIPQWDLAFSVVLLLLILALPEPCPRPRSWLARGAMAGGLALFNPATAMLAGLWALWRASCAGRRWALLGAWACGAVIVMAPWAARNHATLGTWALRTNSGIALYTSFNDCAEPSFLHSFERGCFNTYQVAASAPEAAVLQSMGEVAYNQRCARLAFDWIGAHPVRSLELTAGRVREFWLPPLGARWPYGVAAWITTLLGLAGCAAALRAGQRDFWFLVLAFALFPLPYYFVVSDQRYSAQLAWALQIPAGWLVARLTGKLSLRPR